MLAAINKGAAASAVVRAVINDGRNPLASPAQDKVGTERFPLLLLKLLEVIDQHKAVTTAIPRIVRNPSSEPSETTNRARLRLIVLARNLTGLDINEDIRYRALTWTPRLT